MTPEERELLNRVVKTVEDNNEILHAMRRSQRLGTIVRVVYWVVIIGASLGAFWLIQPYLNMISGGTTTAGNVIDQYKDLLN